MRVRGLSLVASALLSWGALAACGPDDEPSGLCDAAALQQALSQAGPGDVVTVGVCRVEGRFDVPAGVTLSGAGVGQSVIVGPAGDTAVAVDAGEDASIVRDLSVESADVGVRVDEAGSAVVERVEITASRGMALGADGVASLALRSVVLRGPLTREAAALLSSEPLPEDTATIGLALLDVASAELTDVEVSGFAGWGVLATDSTTTWTGGRVAQNLGAGIQVQGGSATLDAVEVLDTLQGGLLRPSMGVVANGGAVVDTTGLALRDNDNFGLLIAGASGTHTDLLAQDGGDAAVWLQQATDVTLAGAEILDNRFGGVVALESSDLELADVRVERTTLLTSVSGVQGRIEVGDGVQLVASTENIRLSRATLAGNERVGLFVDLGAGDASGIAIDDVDVTATGDAYGAVIQNGDATDDWDGAILRHGDAAANDAAFADADPLPVAERVDDVPTVDPDDVRAVMGPNN